MAAKINPNIIYWAIPKCVSHLISSKIMQEANFHGSRVEEVSVYPGTMFVSTVALKLGSLSYLTHHINYTVGFLLCYF